VARGGARPGAGRKPGSTTARTREIADKACSEGLTPLEFMLQVMRDEEADRGERLDMAKAAAPYIHPRLSSIEAQVDVDLGGDFGEIEWQLVKAPAKGP
jgi:hypothetical protein